MYMHAPALQDRWLHMCLCVYCWDADTRTMHHCLAGPLSNACMSEGTCEHCSARDSCMVAPHVCVCIDHKPITGIKKNMHLSNPSCKIDSIRLQNACASLRCLVLTFWASRDRVWMHAWGSTGLKCSAYCQTVEPFNGKNTLSFGKAAKLQPWCILHNIASGPWMHGAKIMRQKYTPMPMHTKTQRLPHIPCKGPELLGHAFGP